MEVYTVLLLENDYYTSKEFYGVYITANAVKVAIRDLVAKGEKIEMFYRDHCTESDKYLFNLEDERLIARTRSIRIKKKYQKNNSFSENSYTIYIYKSEVENQ